MQQNFIIDRRTALRGVATLTAVSPLGLRFALAADTTEKAGLAAIMLAAKKNPYVEAASTIFEVYGAISGHSFESETTAALTEIKRKLDVIDHKIDTLMTMVSNLPEALVARLNEEKYKDARLEISNKQAQISDILASPASYEHNLFKHKLILSSAAKKNVIEYTKVVLNHAYTLMAWGGNSFISLGQAWAILLLTSRATGVAALPLDTVRARFLACIQTSQRHYEEYGHQQLMLRWNDRHEVERLLSGNIYLGNSSIRHPLPDHDWREEAVGFCGSFSGSIESGVRKGQVRRCGYNNSEGYPWLYKIGEHIAARVSGNIDSGDGAADRAVETANSLAAGVRESEARSREAYALSEGAKKVLAGIERSLPSLAGTRGPA